MPKRALVGLIAALSALTLTPLAVAQESSLRLQPGADQMNLYTPEQHDLYDGHFVMSAGRIYQVGTLEDPPGWNHIGNDGSNLRQLTGSIDIDVDERANTGTFVARLDLPEGEMVIEMERFHEFNPCQDGGVAAFIYEHGDSGCGDTNWPKTVIYLAGWGWGRATLDGRPLYDEYQIHFMVTQGMRDRDSLEVRYPLVGKRTRAGAVNPAALFIAHHVRAFLQV